MTKWSKKSILLIEKISIFQFSRVFNKFNANIHTLRLVNPPGQLIRKTFVNLYFVYNFINVGHMIFSSSLRSKFIISFSISIYI